MAIVTAAPTVVVTSAVTLVMPGAENVRVRAPTVPAMLNPLNVAVPVALVVTEVVPLSEPPPDVMATLTTIPASGAELPFASVSCTTGCAAKEVRFTALDGGFVVRTTFVGVGVPVAVKTIGVELVD